MVDLDTVKQSNSQIKKNTPNPIALFVGGTSGVGETTAKHLAKYTTTPTVFLVGRNEGEANRIITELKQINAGGKYSFIKSDVSLIKNVDTACEEVKRQTDRLDILFMSQGSFPIAARNETEEGLDKLMTLRYYSRLRFTQNLLPLLNNSQTSPRVVSVLEGGGRETKIVEDDMDLKTSFTLLRSMHQPSSMTTLAFDALSLKNPNVGFVHTFPFIVKTNLFSRDVSGPVAFGMEWIVKPLLSPFAVGIEETGERMVFHATAPRYNRGCFSVDWNGEVPNAPKVLQDQRQRGVPEKVWQHTVEMFKKITGS